MRIHFVSYGGGDLYKKSVKRIRKEAKSLHFFDSIKILRPQNLPKSITKSILFDLEERGNGYWLWKPFIILEELKSLSYEDILVYSDCGNLLLKGNGWNEFLNILKEYDGIFQQYRNVDTYPWGNSIIKKWTKKSMIDFFSQDGDYSWVEEQQFQASFIILKKNRATLKLIESWFRVMWTRPDLLIDTFGNEDNIQNDDYIEHRHDQAILSAILLKQNYAKVYHMPEIVEPSQQYKDSVVQAIRSRDNFYISKNKRMKTFLKRIIGDKYLNIIRNYFNQK